MMVKIIEMKKKPDKINLLNFFEKIDSDIEYRETMFKLYYKERFKE